jgi:SAM-dependent methyltransferase
MNYLMFKNFRRKIKKKIPKSIKDYFFSIRQIPKRFKNYRLICQNLNNCKTIEIGGPSTMFYTKLPIYQNLRSLDVVNFSNSTTWEGNIQEGYNCNYYGNRFAYQFISEASLLTNVNNNTYDAVVSSHCLEHLANPIKGLMRWKQVLKSGGFMLLILPHKIGNFDHKRKDTTFEHIMSDYINDVDENDNTHFNEFIQLFDLEKKPGKKITLEEHIEITKNNFKNREVHHHVFNKKLIDETLNFCNFEILDYLEEKEDLIIFCKNIV